MKVLQINCVFRKGSTGKIVDGIHEELKIQGYQSIVCYGRGRRIEEADVYKFCTEFEANVHTMIIRTGLVLNYGGLFLPTLRLKRIIEKEYPDIVHIHCANGSSVNIYSLLKCLAKKSIKTIITHHAGFYYTGSCEHAYDCQQFMQPNGCHHCPIKFKATRSKTWDNSGRAWRRMRDAIACFDHDNLMFTAVSPWLKERSLHSNIVNKYRCEVVLNGVNTDIFKHKPGDNLIVRKIDKSYHTYALYVTAAFNPYNKGDNKGGWYIVELAKRLPEVCFIVVSLRSANIEALPSNVYFWGKAESQDQLASLYNSADLTVITSKRETFSMVCAESLCCGTPVAGFKAGGPESISLTEYSKFVEYGNIDDLESAIKHIPGIFNKQVISERAVQKFSNERMVKGYMDCYKSLVGDIK